MCRRICKGGSAFYLNTVNLLHFLGGCLILGYGGYMLHEENTTFTKGILALGGSVFFIGFVGMCGVSRGQVCCLGFYSYLMLLLGLAQTALIVALYIDEDKVMGDIKDDKARDFTQKHFDVIRYTMIGLAASEVLGFLLARSYMTMVAVDNERLRQSSYSSFNNPDSPTNNYGYQPKSYSTEKADAQRQRMIEKYGDRFAKGSVQAEERDPSSLL